jgi:hypothetical protein
MFRPLLGHHQVYCLCLGAELFLILVHILNIKKPGGKRRPARRADNLAAIC